MSAVPNNGVVVRGLRVLRTSQYRRANPWRTVVSLLLQAPSDEVDEWHHLTVTDAAGTVVAQRRFDRRKRAESARKGFVKRVEALDEADLCSTNWQALLNSA